jgi:tRNA(His) 5'-end guanylyltransferase
MKLFKFDFAQMGAQVKQIESQFDQQLIPGMPVVVRLDGKNFHNFTKGLDKPFDAELSTVMAELVMWLCKTFNAVIGYTQSDEITLIFDNPIQESASMQTIFFDGRCNKINSILAAKTSVKFNQLIAKYEKFADKLDSVPVFDCRCMSFPESILRNSVVWRQMDCRKNSVSMAAHAHFSHKSLQGKNTKQKIEELFDKKGIIFSDYPDQFRNGLLIIRSKIVRPLTDEEKLRIPEKFQDQAASVSRTVFDTYADVVLQKMTPGEVDEFLFTWF